MDGMEVGGEGSRKCQSDVRMNENGIVESAWKNKIGKRVEREEHQNSTAFS